MRWLLLLAACGASTPTPVCEPCPRVVITERVSPPITRTMYIHCGDYGPPASPQLDTCPDPIDLYTAGSCANLNRARRLDHATQLEHWSEYVAAVCGLRDKPAWGSKP